MLASTSNTSENDNESPCTPFAISSRCSATSTRASSSQSQLSLITTFTDNSSLNTPETSPTTSSTSFPSSSSSFDFPTEQAKDPAPPPSPKPWHNPPPPPRTFPPPLKCLRCALSCLPCSLTHLPSEHPLNPTHVVVVSSSSETAKGAKPGLDENTTVERKMRSEDDEPDDNAPVRCTRCRDGDSPICLLAYQAVMIEVTGRRYYNPGVAGTEIDEAVRILLSGLDDASRDVHPVIRSCGWDRGVDDYYGDGWGWYGSLERRGWEFAPRGTGMERLDDFSKRCVRGVKRRLIQPSEIGLESRDAVVVDEVGG